jgi:hypothetical protein
MVIHLVRSTVRRRNIPLELEISSVCDKHAVLRQSHCHCGSLSFSSILQITGLRLQRVVLANMNWSVKHVGGVPCSNHKTWGLLCFRQWRVAKCNVLRPAIRVLIERVGFLPPRAEWAQLICANSSWKMVCPTIDVRAVSPLTRCGIGQNFRSALENRFFNIYDR